MRRFAVRCVLGMVMVALFSPFSASAGTRTVTVKSILAYNNYSLYLNGVNATGNNIGDYLFFKGASSDGTEIVFAVSKDEVGRTIVAMALSAKTNGYKMTVHYTDTDYKFFSSGSTATLTSRLVYWAEML